ncbi:hypothetical protein D0859_02235 [Hortaea werneckii]|uniref:10 kDa heat shock protein, mitochondrial n=2 Tax=Hortaea werneckii TaxID=91943 RepID=A0A3M7J786_HORWE|nr:hypothetical protein D0859_02235 [Hortaea werneckii]
MYLQCYCGEDGGRPHPGLLGFSEMMRTDYAPWSFHVLREKFQSVVAPCIHHTFLLPPEKSNRRITVFISFISIQQSKWGSQHPKLKLQQTTALKSIKSLAPLLDRVLVQRVKAEAKTAGGLFLPETAVKELNEAKVLAVGPGLVTKEGSRIPMSVHQGDKVLIPQFGGSPIKVGEEEYQLFRDSDILAKINE